MPRNFTTGPKSRATCFWNASASRLNHCFKFPVQEHANECKEGIMSTRTYLSKTTQEEDP